MPETLLRSAGGVRALIGWASGSMPNLAVTSAIGLGLASGKRRLCGLRRVDFELAVGRTANPVWRLREPVMDSMLRGLLAGKMEPRRFDWQNCCQFGCSSRDDSPDREGVAKMFGVSAVHFARFWSSLGSSRVPSRFNLWPVFLSGAPDNPDSWAGV